MSWKPLERSVLQPNTPEQLEAQAQHLLKAGHFPDIEKARDQVTSLYNETMAQDKVWINDIYQVNVREHGGLDVGEPLIVVHLSIKRRDKQPCKDWRHFQLIKNQLVGDECEGVEIYPAESRLVDTSNQYHIWCIKDPKYTFPFGWDAGRITAEGSVGGAIQRDFEE